MVHYKYFLTENIYMNAYVIVISMKLKIDWDIEFMK